MEKLTIIDLDGNETKIEIDIDEKVEAIVAYRLRQRTRERDQQQARAEAAEAEAVVLEDNIAALQNEADILTQRLENAVEAVTELTAENAALRAQLTESESRFRNCKRLEANAQNLITELEAQLAGQGWHSADDDPPTYDWYVTETDEAHTRKGGKSPYLVQFYDGSWLHRLNRWMPVNIERPASPS